MKIDQLIQRAEKMKKENIIFSLEGMKERYDQTLLLKTTKLPVLFIVGVERQQSSSFKNLGDDLASAP